MANRVFLALDIGASNGRAIAGALDDSGRLRFQEVYRFPNGFVRLNGGLYWDYAAIYRELLAALRECRRRDLELACIGIDAWSEDYALLDSAGQVLGLPRCYRDPVIGQYADGVDALLGDPQAFYRASGQVKNRISSLRQLYCDCTRQPKRMEAADQFLFIPYLFAYLFTGQAAYDATLPAIGELGDAGRRSMRVETLSRLGIAHLAPPQFQSGTLLGRTNRTVLEETGYDAVPVACIDAHDTSSAVLAIGSDEEFLYVSSGTWSMYGAVTDGMRLDGKAYAAKLCNSPLGDGRVSLMAGTAGMFCIQQCMRAWQAEGRRLTYPELTRYALTHRTDAYFSFDDIPDDAADMPAAVARAAERAGFRPPEDPFALYEMFANSLARLTVQDLLRTEDAVGRRFDRVYLVGGGSQAGAVNRRISEGSGKRVFTGMQEAAVTGNLLAQMVATGELRDFAEARAVSRRTFPMQDAEETI